MNDDDIVAVVAVVAVDYVVVKWMVWFLEALGLGLGFWTVSKSTCKST